MRKVCSIFLLFLLSLSYSGVFAQSENTEEETQKSGERKERFKRGIVKRTFVPKGQWFFGGTCSYTELENDNYHFLFIKDWSGKGYTFSLKPFVGYMVRDDLGVGVNFTYERNLLEIDKMDLKLSDDLSFNIEDWYNLQHIYSVSLVMRIFMNIEDSRRFGLFNDVKLMFGGGQGKYINGKGDVLDGTYQTIYQTGLIYSPGLCVFINDYAAVEASVGLLGVQTKHINQKINNIESGSFRKSSANFKIDLFSIGLGFAIYL